MFNTTLNYSLFLEFTRHDFPLSPGATNDGNVAVSGNGAISGKTNTGICQQSFLVGLGQSFQLLL